MKVSVIVPVYNTVEPLLERCLTSCAVQEGVEVEVVLVDDGSWSLTAELCERLFSNLGLEGRVVHQENQGLSVARNTGIESCSGDWIYFLDSDDLLADGTSLARLCERAAETEADVVVGRFHFPCGYDCSPASGRDWLLRSLRCGKVSFAAPDTLIERVRCADGGVLFEPGLIHEDEDYMPRLLLAARRVVGAEGGDTYVRVPSEDSITSSTSEVARFRRCRGKLVVCRNSLVYQAFREDCELFELIQARAFGFANMAFLAWARDRFASGHENELRRIAREIDYSESRLGSLCTRNFRTTVCMRVARTLGPERYVDLLAAVFDRGEKRL